jgi:hypothetical protein
MCGQSGCARKIKVRGFCKSHYTLALRYGRLPPRPTTEDRYESKVDRSGGPRACHPWTAHRTRVGYGKFSNGGETLACRWAYKHFVGPLQDGQDVLHRCDNPPCQNRDHWFIGDDRLNTEDKIRKERQWRPIGEKNVKAKLTEDQVREIRTSDLSRQTLAVRYGVTVTTIAYAQTGKTWRHVLPSAL